MMSAQPTPANSPDGAHESGLILAANSTIQDALLATHVEQHGTSFRPRILTLGQWIEHCWSQLQRKGHPQSFATICEPATSIIVWRKVLASVINPISVSNLDSMASLAHDAGRLVEASEVCWQDFFSRAPARTQSFLSWLPLYHAELQHHELVTPEKAMTIIVNAFDEGLLSCEPVISLAGMFELNALTRRLLRSSSKQLSKFSPKVGEGKVVRATALSNMDEVVNAAHWCQAILSKQPNARIGVLVPGLKARKDEIRRSFSGILNPNSIVPGNHLDHSCFKLCCDEALLSTPVVSSAFSLLKLQQAEWDLDFICNLLQSPFWGGEKPSALITHLISALRGLGKFKVTQEDLLLHCEKVSLALGIDGTNSLIHRLKRVESAHTLKSKSTWGDFFQQHLELLGWPGPNPLTPAERQPVEQFNESLDLLRACESLSSNSTHEESLDLLAIVLSHQLASRDASFAPIHIIDVDEAYHLQFDYCWVMGLNDGHWPPIQSPNPLIDLDHQRRLGVRAARIDAQTSVARKQLAYFRHCAPVVVFSCAETIDGRDALPHHSIRDVTEVAIEQVAGNHRVAEADSYKDFALSKGIALEAVSNDQAPAFNSDLEPLRGGAQVIKEQASCPFNAFAKLRLGAHHIEQPMAGFTPAERGNMLHEALAIVWRKLRTQKALLEITQDKLLGIVSEAARTAISPMRMRRYSSISFAYQKLEEERLTSLILRWLDLEKTRPSFTVVAIEESVTTTFAGLPLHLRIDRIDELADGSLLLIDYKSGSPALQSLMGERMDEPQLPLYAVTTEQIKGVAFAQINTKGLKWIGIGELGVEHDGISLIEASWVDQIQQWKKSLESIADEFKQGDARVLHKDATTFRYAEHLLPLNRHAERMSVQHYLAAEQKRKPL